MPRSRRGSKKPSAANSASKPPEPLVFFIDRSLGRLEVASALRAVGADVRVHDDLFPQDVEDIVWLTEAGRQGWIILTKDARIRQRLNERLALRRANARAIILTSQNLTGEAMAQIFVAALPRIERLARRQPGPFVATLSRSAILQVLH